MNTPSAYRRLARECLQWAASETDEARRQALIDNANTLTLAALKLELPDGGMDPCMLPGADGGVSDRGGT
jgi:hypothetical protein